MIATFIIALREYLEVFLIIGVFFGISHRLKLNKDKRLIIASIIGIVISFLLPTATYLFGEQAHAFLNEKTAEILEGYLMIFSGIFLAYVVHSLHDFFIVKRSKLIITTHDKIQRNIFDMSIFLTIIFFIVREGVEIALFTATTSLFSRFAENMLGLLLGFIVAAIFGILTFLSYIRFPIGKIFRLTEYFIMILGAAMIANGLGELTEQYYNIHLSSILPFSIDFLPHKSTFIGSLLKTFTGLEKNFSVAKLTIMSVYIIIFYLLIFRKTYPKYSIIKS